MIVLDSSVLYAFLDRNDSRHAEVVSWYRDVDDEATTTPLVLAEVDHLVLRRARPAALDRFWSDVAAGAFEVDWWPTAAADSVEIARQYRDLGLGLTDASLVALAARRGTNLLATLDERHFRAVRPVDGADAFTLLPADAAGHG